MPYVRKHVFRHASETKYKYQFLTSVMNLSSPVLEVQNFLWMEMPARKNAIHLDYSYIDAIMNLTSITHSVLIIESDTLHVGFFRCATLQTRLLENKLFNKSVKGVHKFLIQLPTSHKSINTLHRRKYS